MMIEPVLHLYNIGEALELKTTEGFAKFDNGTVVAFSTTRHGGASQGRYGELNINPYCGDDMTAIGDNRSALCHELGIDDSHLVLPHQVHGIKCLKVDSTFFSASPSERQRLLEGYDALMTDLKGVCIGVSTADCIPVLVYDPRRHVTAAIHAGWRGTVARIVEKTLLAMKASYCTVTEEAVAIIGPGISLKNFEVGQEVYDTFAAAGFEMGDMAKRFPCKDDPQKEKWHIDLPLCNKLQLMHAGVREQNILCSDICTYDNADDFFSARRLGINSGRIYTGIMIKQ